MLIKEERVCGCDNPYCNLPVDEEKDSDIIENADKDYKPIAKGCKTKKVGLTTSRIREEIYNSMIP